jgi:hypothetical protein
MDDRQRLEIVKEYINTIEFNIKKLNEIMFKRCTGRTTREVISICDHILSNKNVTNIYVFSTNRNISYTYSTKIVDVLKVLDINIHKHTKDRIEFTRLLDNKDALIKFLVVSDIQGTGLFERFRGVRVSDGVSFIVTHDFDDEGYTDDVFNDFREFIEINGGKII